MKGKLKLVPGGAPRGPVQTETAIDPVCGMTVDPRTAAGSHVHAGRTYWFCATSCLDRFRADPDRYLASRAGAGAHAPTPEGTEPQASGHTAAHHAGAFTCPMHPEVREARPEAACPMCGMALEPATIEAPATRTEWVCPMHPEVVRSGPGACPICGMALEPRVVTLEEEVSPELRDMTRRFWVGLALTVPLVAVAMSDLIPGQPLQHAVSPRALAWLQLLLATPVVLWGGAPFFERAWASVVNRSPNMFTLIALGTGTAYGYSVAATLAPGLFPPAAGATAARSGVYFEVAAVDHGPGAAGPGAGAAGPEPDERRDPGAAGAGPDDGTGPPRRRAGRRTCRSTRSRSATASACGPASASRSMASSSRGAAPSTSRWSPASRCPSRRRPGTGSRAAPSTGRAPS